jgi:membrane-associated phospholipid phosphatase
LRLLDRFRLSEWILLTFFLYVAVLASSFHLRAGFVVRAWLMLAGIFALFSLLRNPALAVARDWLPLGLVLLAYREMDWFSVSNKARILERRWLLWDHQYLYDHGFREWIEALGPVLPNVLEFSYLLVYGVGFFSVAALYIARRREQVDRFLTVYLAGTLLSYALFPYFPSDPPRVVFAGADLPRYLTGLRQLNLLLVGGYGIHSSVFPSAHVSSAFAAAWGLWRFLPEHRAVAWAALAYASVVSIATVYGRYHYGVDALAGIVVSLFALGFALGMRPA